MLATRFKIFWQPEHLWLILLYFYFYCLTQKNARGAWKILSEEILQKCPETQ